MHYKWPCSIAMLSYQRVSLQMSIRILTLDMTGDWSLISDGSRDIPFWTQAMICSIQALKSWDEILTWSTKNNLSSGDSASEGSTWLATTLDLPGPPLSETMQCIAMQRQQIWLLLNQKIYTQCIAGRTYNIGHTDWTKCLHFLRARAAFREPQVLTQGLSLFGPQFDIVELSLQHCLHDRLTWQPR